MLYLVSGMVRIHRYVCATFDDQREERVQYRIVEADDNTEAMFKFVEHFESEHSDHYVSRCQVEDVEAYETIY